MINTRFLAVAGLAVGIFTVSASPSFSAGSCSGCPDAKKEVKTSVNAKQTAKTDASTGKYADISLADLKKALAEKKVTVIDVNGSESFKAGRIPTAIDFAATTDLKAKLPADKNALIVAYCGSPQCGAYKKAANAATKLGYTNVAHFSGGISGWKAAGEAVEKG